MVAAAFAVWPMPPIATNPKIAITIRQTTPIIRYVIELNIFPTPSAADETPSPTPSAVVARPSPTPWIRAKNEGSNKAGVTFSSFSSWFGC